MTRAISPRPSVRVPSVDAAGQVLNDYPGQVRVDGPAPDCPWAVYLADAEGWFRLLAFDFDAKTTVAAAAAARDADTVAGFLAQVGLTPVVCQSGPSGGRHVWVGLAERVDAETVAALARLARHLCPSLDLAPLTNPATGCVRPPGTPHRAGGSSTVLGGDVSTLSDPTGTASQVCQLVEHLARLVTDTRPADTLDPHRRLPVDEHGRVYLPGPRRALPARSAAALHQDAATGDASAVLWRVLIGAAAARWRHADIAALVDTAPGLEHLRSVRVRSGRRPRPSHGQGSAAAVLRRQWDKAVKYVATTSRRVGDDPTFDMRAEAITAHVRQVQARADATPGRWVSGGGPADRRVLDVLCLLAVQALTPTVEADIRRLALLGGIGRETARTALLRLTADGWITRTCPADGPHGAHWTIDPHEVIPRVTETDRSQAVPRPVGAGTAQRIVLIDELTTRLTDAVHDLFTTPGAFGLFAGALYAHTSLQSQPAADLARTLGVSREVVTELLTRLAAIGVLVVDRQGWRRQRSDRRGIAARQLGVAGRLTERAHRYTVERTLWAWWQAEHAWMRTPGRSPRRQAPAGQLMLALEHGETSWYPPYPRQGGRADHQAARTMIISGERGADPPVAA